MKEILQGSESQRNEPGLFSRFITRYRNRQFERLIGELPTGRLHHKSKDANIEVDRNYDGAVKVVIWDHQKGGGGGTCTEIVATHSEYSIGPSLVGVSVSQTGFRGDEVTWELGYSSFADPQQNQLSGGEVVEQLRLAKQVANNPRI